MIINPEQLKYLCLKSRNVTHLIKRGDLSDEKLRMLCDYLRGEAWTKDSPPARLYFEWREDRESLHVGYFDYPDLYLEWPAGDKVKTDE